ncbi:ABC-2 family transporter protein [Synechococcus sp. PCC 7336]|uniref:ABC transporter permease n=1 Tax=Synechococcus sp. PCC 7336 TaxID=195250 RepID=UPI0003493A6A|nr:ABC-2 family transporter protein [Synechococcus sp. PCC 7336]
MRQVLRRARVLLVVYYAYMLEYRAELVFWLLSGTLPFIVMGIWMEAARTGSFPLSPLEFARYFLAVFLIRQLSVVWVIWDFEKEILEGKLSPLLLQPIDPVWRHFAGHAAERIARTPFIAIAVGFFFCLYPAAFWLPRLDRLLMFAIAAGAVFAMRFLIQYTLAISSFWIERSTALFNLWFLFYIFLSGMIAPLDVFPEAVRQVVLWTPLPYLVDFPANLLLGRPVSIGQAIAVFAIWGGVLLALNRWLWRRGLRHYSAMGA